MNDLLEKKEIHHDDAAFVFSSCASNCLYCPCYFTTIINGEEIIFSRYIIVKKMFSYGRFCNPTRLLGKG
jgi:hypothetical protein